MQQSLSLKVNLCLLISMKVESRHLLRLPAAVRANAYKSFCTNTTLSKDPRISNLGRVIRDEYAILRDSYGTPMKVIGCSRLKLTTTSNPLHPIVLAHGLLGFNELRLSGQIEASEKPSHQRH